MNVKEMLIPKSALEANIKEHLKKQLEEEMEKLKVENFRFIDIDWVQDGIVLYYEDTESKE